MITGTVCTILGRRQPTRRGTMGGVSSGGWFQYGPGSVRLRRSSAFSIVRRVRGGPFRMIELNIVGWSALLAPSALIGGLVALALGGPVAVGAFGVVGAALVVAVARDRWRWWNSVVSVSSDLDLDELRRVVDRLRVEGVDVTLDAADSGLAVSPGSDRNEDVDRWKLTTHQRWANRVMAALDDASAARPPD
jgi:hypothetical protein